MSILTAPPAAHILAHAKPVTEFVPRPDGTLFNGTCTEAAGEECLAIAKGRDPTLANVAVLAQDMIAHNIADPSGATNLDNITQELIKRGATVAAKLYGPDQATWIKLFRDEANVRPVLVQFANANVLHDLYSPLRVEPGVMRHAEALVGVTPGVCYWFMDPDHPQGQERLVGYTLSELIAAQPYGILVLEMEAPQVATPTLPSGWRDDGKMLIGPTVPGTPDAYGFTDASGMREYALKLLSLGILSADDMAIESAITLSPTRVEQCTQYSCLVLEQDAQGHWSPFRSNLGREHQVHRASPPPPPPVVTPAPEPAPPPPDPNKVKLARAQAYLGGENTLGVFCGIWTFGKRATEMAPIAQSIKTLGFDYAYLKFEESGIQFFPDPITEYQKVFADQGLKVIPYLYDRPQYTQVDVDTALKLIDVFGGIDLDMEEVFLHEGVALYSLVHAIRSQRPEAVILADGYGDPVSAFGRGGFPFDAIKDADLYQPQWYESFLYGGLPGAMSWAQWQTALTNNDQQVGDEFARAGLGRSFPIRPCVDGVMSNDVATNVGAWAARFGLGLTVWEYKYCTAALVAALKAGFQKGQGS